jgi:hypothetical protein
MIKLEQKRKLFMSCNAAIFRRKCLAEAGWFMPELKWHCDWFGVNIPAYRYGVCYVPEALTRFFILPNSYFKAGRRNEAAHREALEALMERLTRPEYANECELIRRAGSLYQFGGPMRSILWRNKNYRKFLTPVFLRNNLWYSTKLFLKKFTPAWAGNLYFKFAGYRAKPAKKA